MSDIKLVRPHSLPLTKAKALAQKTADALAAEYDLERVARQHSAFSSFGC